MPAILIVLAATVLFGSNTPNCQAVLNPNAAAAEPNDNRAAAGVLKDGVLTVRLVARPAAWYPEGRAGCALRVHAFAEEDRPAQIPGPLIRVRAGTEVRITLRNELNLTLRIRGLTDGRPVNGTLQAVRQLVDATALQLAAGETREVRFRPTEPGTFYYWGNTPIDTLDAYPRRLPGAPMPLFSPFEDGQLVGALIVDPAEGSPPDRIFVMTHWRLQGTDPDETGIRQINAINGLSYPHTEQLSAGQGEKLRWRVLNPMNVAHTMHLHGFYFRVLSVGGPAIDSIVPPALQREVVSEFMAAYRTMTLEWTPDRAGNWLFHCHWLAHISPAQRIDRVFGSERVISTHADGHGGDHMAGLVLGVVVQPKPGVSAIKAATPRRQLRLYASERARVFGEQPGLGFVLQEGPAVPARDSIRIPGTPIVLNKNESAQIIVYNRLRVPLAVHWHGIELESYYDGVPDFSGARGNIAAAIVPGDSFIVHMTPPRAGTFFYHVHSEEANELLAGLYGALIVVDPARPLDPAHDRTFVLSAGALPPNVAQNVFVNGSKRPEPIELAAGVTQRFRLISISSNGSFDVRIVGPSFSPVWKQVAQDGADLPAQQLNESAALVRVPVGAAMDFEFTPTRPGAYSLQVDLPRGVNGTAGFATTVPIIVRSVPGGLEAQERRRALERALALIEDPQRWTGSRERTLPLSDLLWTVFCALEPAVPSGGDGHSPCRDLAGLANGSYIDAGTREQARALIRRALER